jgi:NAD(P)-dependent dehydrogenase (short-subunit alcohol dehydrogenase family)
MIDLKGKVVIVTGASSGIGAALAQAFSRQGARVTLTARRLHRLREVAGGCPGDILITPADQTREKDRKEVVQQTMARWSRIDILVNNAGLGMYGPFRTTTETDWRQIFEINLFSMVFLTQAVLPIMQPQGEGLLVNLASIAGLFAHSDKVTPYVASKHAVVGFSRGLARDLAGTGIRVLAVCPHLTDTEFFTVFPGAQEMAPVVEKFKSFMDSPEEVARGILNQLDSGRLVIFPTGKAARAYEKRRDI